MRTPLAEQHDSGAIATGHHMWHEVLEIFGGPLGVAFVAVVGLAAWWIYCGRQARRNRDG